MRKHAKAVIVWAIIALLAVAMLPAPLRAADPDVVRLTFNAGLYDDLPLMLAVDKGYFAAENLDVHVTKTPGNHAVLIPSLARGDIDVSPQIMAPAFFNQYTQGFGIKIVAPIDEARKGWYDSQHFMVREDVWESKAIRKPEDLRGKKLPKPYGGPSDFLNVVILAKGGLTLSNVILNPSPSGSISNVMPALMNKQFDGLGVSEPIATQLEKMGVAHRWLGYQDVSPYYQTGYIAFSPQFAARRAVAQRFMNAYLRACRDIAATNGKWTPELIDAEVKWSGQSRDIIASIPGPAYPGLGDISTVSISRQEQLWIQLGLMKTAVPIKDLMDDSFARSARATLHLK